MNTLQAIILGIIQGLTEFLPVSSSGHLVLLQRLFGIDEGVLTFGIALHLATLVGIFFVFSKDIIAILKKPFSKMTLLLVAGTIPTVIMAALLKDFFEKTMAGKTLGYEFIFTGLILLLAETIRSKNKKLDDMKYSDAAIIGVAQGVAILPAVSRSGLTLAGALARGLNREFAIKFSMLLSIPAILGAALFESFDVIKDFDTAGLGVEILPLVAGMLAAGISGYFAIKFMLKVFSKVSFKIFSYYVFVLGILIIAEQLFYGKIF